MLNLELFFGYLGSFMAASIFLPQVYASYKSKDTSSLSWLGIIVGMLNGICWICYGLLKNDPFIYVTNSISFVGAFLLMTLKKKYG